MLRQRRAEIFLPRHSKHDKAISCTNTKVDSAVSDVNALLRSTVGTPGRGARHVDFDATTHARLLLRIDRTLLIREAINRTVKPGDRVLDAGCGTGLLSLLSIEAGAKEVLAVDRDHVSLAKELVRENRADGQIKVIEGDLSTLLHKGEISGKFDLLLTFLYTNHIIADEGRSFLIDDLLHNVGSDDCAIIPSKVVYRAVACDWPQFDASSEIGDLRRMISGLEHRYSLKFDSLFNSVASEVHFSRSRPNIHEDYGWMPGSAGGAYRYQRGSGRFLSDEVLVTSIGYGKENRFKGLPKKFELKLSRPGTLTGMMWIQELWFEDLLIWVSESFSPVSAPIGVRQNDKVTAHLDESWRNTNVLPVSLVEKVQP